MSTLPRHDMTADEFIAWSLAEPRDREGGRFELVDGRVVEMQSERVSHIETKQALWAALRDAIRRSGLPCRALTDGATVRVSPRKVYKPDGVVYCGDRLPPDTIEIPAPVVIIEIVSPDSIGRDHGEKVEAYFSLASVQHYLIVDAERGAVVHHSRTDGEALLTRICRAGTINLDPPGIGFETGELFDRG